MHARVEGHLKEEYCQQSIRVRTQVPLRRITDICTTTSDKIIMDLTISPWSLAQLLMSITNGRTLVSHSEYSFNNLLFSTARLLLIETSKATGTPS